MRVAYVRVSSLDQNEARQLEALEKYNIEKWFVEKISAKNTKRPKLKEMLEFIREGDVVYIIDFSRLARSTKDLLELVEIIREKNVQLVSVEENFDTSTASGKLMLTVIAAIYEFERQNLLERQAEGIAIAKREGKFKGGQVKKIDEQLFLDAYDDYVHRRITKVVFAKRLDVSRPTLNKILKDRGLGIPTLEEAW